jgi:hypothetical protein
MRGNYQGLKCPGKWYDWVPKTDGL